MRALRASSWVDHWLLTCAKPSDLCVRFAHTNTKLRDGPAPASNAGPELLALLVTLSGLSVGATVFNLLTLRPDADLLR